LSEKIKIKKQVFLFPTFFHLPTSKSYEKYGDWYLLDKKTMKWFAEQYINDIENDRKNKLLSPLLYQDDILKKLPSSYFILCERDPLFSEGEFYKDKLLSLGIEVVCRTYSAEHGFIFFEKFIKEADLAIKDLKENLYETFKNELSLSLS
jgi:acetyl esterase/lipase